MTPIAGLPQVDPTAEKVAILENQLNATLHVITEIEPNPNIPAGVKDSIKAQAAALLTSLNSANKELRGRIGDASRPETCRQRQLEFAELQIIMRTWADKGNMSRLETRTILAHFCKPESSVCLSTDDFDHSPETLAKKFFGGYEARLSSTAQAAARQMVDACTPKGVKEI